MKVYCTRSGCSNPKNYFTDLDDRTVLKKTGQRYCTTCGMPLILRDRYIPTDKLGSGGFGTAFLAIDRDIPGITHRQCVVKQFQPAGNLSDGQMQLAQDLFEREGVVLTEIGNLSEQIPNLYAYFELTVPSLQPGKQDNFFYLVQEFISGQNLEQELSDNGNFSETKIIELLREILNILKFVHKRNIIHRDIKPSNIMRDETQKLFLIDFGAVKQVKVIPGIPGSSTGIYSPGYAPQEQMNGGQVFPCSDLYALAVTSIVLLTGEEPEKLYDSYNIKWDWEKYVRVSPHLADILNIMLRTSPRDRYQSAEEVLEALLSNSQKPIAPAPVSTPTLPKSSTPLTPSTPIREFSTLEILSGAAFSGFEGSLIGIALSSFLPAFISLPISALVLGLIILAQTRRLVERYDLLIIGAITFAVVYFIVPLQGGLAIGNITLLCAAGALVAIAVTSLFRLIYRLLSLMINN
jgi:serine/threonine-protein kinase